MLTIALLLAVLLLPCVAVELAAMSGNRRRLLVLPDQARDYVTERGTGRVLVCTCPAMASDPCCPVHGQNWGGQ